MAGRPIEIPIAITADGAEKGVSKVTDAFSDIEDSLKDVTKAGEKTSSHLEDDMSAAGKKISRDLTKALDEVKDGSKDAGKHIGRNVKDGTDKAGEGFSEMKDEAKSTAKEAAASFSGIEDSADALQEILANAFSGFGPAGMAAGALAAIGMGLISSALQGNADEINETKEKMLGLAQTIRDNGGVLKESDYISQMEDYGYAIQDTKEWFEIFQEDAISGFEKIKKIADETGISTQKIFKGGFGDLKDSKAELRDVEKRLEALKEKKEALYNLDGSILDPVDANEMQALEEYKKLIEGNIRTQEGAIATQKIRTGAIQDTTQALKDDMAAIEAHTDAMKDSKSSHLDYLDDVDGLTQSLKDNGATIDENTQKGRDNQRAILDVASAIEEQANKSLEAGENTDTVTAKFQAQRDALVNQVMPAFGGSKEKAEAYIDTILRTPNAVNTNVVVNGIPEAEAKVRNFTSVGRHIYVNFETGSTYSVDNYIQGMKAGVTVPVDFAARGKPAIT
jgi:hypothetical protein